MQRDARGLALSTDSAEAVAAFDATIEGYLKYRFDTSQRLKPAFKADPEFGMAHALKAAFMLLGYKQDFIAPARAAIATAESCMARATPREQAHVAALRHWADGEMDRALAAWEAIFAAHPTDILAFRLHHFCAFWLGRPEAMLTAVEGVHPRWEAGMPGFGSVLACRSFAHEECGNYTVAEAAGRDAIALDPGDLWAAHAVAHVLEMQGRRGEGIAWVASLEKHWDGGNNLMHHLWWHRAMYHMERWEHAQVLALYDTGFRNLGSRVTEAQPDLYIDVQNAASMLFRLGLHGVDVGNRWEELAAKAESRIGDCLSAFTLPHWMMALAATGRWEAAQRMLAAMRDYAGANAGTNAPLVHDYALPICDAVLKHGQGDFAGAVAVMRPALSGMYRLGGSHAQQDVLEQLFLHSAMKAGLQEDVRMLLERVAGRHPVPPERRVGYAEAAKSVRH
ncbi:tetratricopeptide repeat protein [Siccirubricoccus sp. KC 17139]|uniref:Tetratricopeptide repeat protein 38 n=1 Tax=Siccirubricoccus soli TaxID=2899147 RepID=A0ABT1D851_9PROT|nr:tetratricopeptide repeat protein [Siccirubricoccus soli]MCO6418116.1 tetratricopeptide repeat protein [Siccirubricoccus soli]MCP2684251.1 tetratricopeptide repeat protein [Siccirubricoccus soli]